MSVFLCFCEVHISFHLTFSIPAQNPAQHPLMKAFSRLPLNLRSYKKSIIVCIVELQPFLQKSSCLGKVFHNFFLMVWETTSCLVLIIFVPMAVLERQMRSSVRVCKELLSLCSFILHYSFIIFYQPSNIIQVVFV